MDSISPRKWRGVTTLDFERSIVVQQQFEVDQPMTKDAKRYQWFGIWRIILTGFLISAFPVASAEDDESVKEIHIYIERQVLIAQENGKEIYNFDIVTGRDGKETTAGTYEIFRKHEKYTSQSYGAEMPYAMFFSADGKAIHGTQMATLRSYLHTYITESVGSHGCVGLTDDNALALFEWAPMGTPVIVVSEYEPDAEEETSE